jgi:hypothetical protein
MVEHTFPCEKPIDGSNITGGHCKGCDEPNNPLCETCYFCIYCKGSFYEYIQFPNTKNCPKCESENLDISVEWYIYVKCNNCKYRYTDNPNN